MIELGNRRELFIDKYLIDCIDGACLKLHAPIARDIVITHDEPWEGNTSYYHTIMRDGNLLRMYYRGSHYDEDRRKMTHEVVCYAESQDGIEWLKPDLGLFAFNGSKHNNIIWTGEHGSHDFAPFRDWNPECPEAIRYKAVGRKAREGLFAFGSSDGIHWSLLHNEPIVTEGAFDSQNLAFWDDVRGCYVEYHRGFRNEVRDIMTSTSTDFVTWSKPEWLDYGDAPLEHLYTNQVEPYPRAPHVYVGFPKRFVPDRNPTRHPGGGVSDIVFMSSRDGVHFKRWAEAFIRPGLQTSRWVNRNNFVAWGLVETGSHLNGVPAELSLYSGEDYYRGTGTKLRRYTIRRDGFVSLSAPLSGGTCVTKPFTFDGTEIELNYSTSAAGTVSLDLLDVDEKPIDGIRFDDIFGDHIDQRIIPAEGRLDQLAGKPVRLRMRMHDADVYSLKFGG